MNRGAALTDALLTTLATPATWPLALAALLLRGGLLVVAAPILVLPSPVGLGNLLAPTLMAAVLGGVSVGDVVVAGLVAVVVGAWIVGGGLIAASLEAGAARIVAGCDGSEGEARDPGPAPSNRRVAGRILAARTVAHLPTALALAWGSARIVAIAYRELTSPFDVASPIAVRVLRGAPEVIAALVIAWMLGEVIGGIAARRIILARVGIARSLRDALVSVVRHPLAVLLGFWIPTAALFLVLLPSTLAASIAWEAVRAALRSSSAPFDATIAVVLFVAVWMVGLALLAVAAAWRAAVWSVAERDVAGPAVRSTEPASS